MLLYQVHSLTIRDNCVIIDEIAGWVSRSAVDATSSETDVRPEHVPAAVAVRQTYDSTSILRSMHRLFGYKLHENKLLLIVDWFHYLRASINRR